VRRGGATVGENAHLEYFHQASKVACLHLSRSARRILGTSLDVETIVLQPRSMSQTSIKCQVEQRTLKAQASFSKSSYPGKFDAISSKYDSICWLKL
jgi:hypothetical protein